MPDPAPTRPEPLEIQSGAELGRWYWLKSELIELARARGVSPSGGKLELTERLAAHLGGEPPPATPARSRDGNSGPGPRKGVQLSGPLTLETVIPDGQRSSQVLRAFFAEAIGPAFRFDGPMREFIAGGAGKTLGDAVSHWHATRDRPKGEIAPQFELNRFVRAWHEANPDGTRAEALQAWRRHRALPVDRR